MQAAAVPVFRPSYLTDGLEFQGSLTESPANIFYVKASRASISSAGSGRFQFQWRSVSDNLLMSPTVMLRFRLKIKCPVIWSQVLQYLAVKGVRAPLADVDEAATYGAAIAVGSSGPIAPASLCFADGDAFTSCCSSINFSFNGTSLSLNRTNYFWRDWMRTQISSKDAARIYKSSGGAYDASDAVGVAVPTYGADGQNRANRAANATPSQAGITMDSGIAERCKRYAGLTCGGGGGSRGVPAAAIPVELAWDGGS